MGQCLSRRQQRQHTNPVCALHTQQQLELGPVGSPAPRHRINGSPLSGFRARFVRLLRRRQVLHPTASNPSLHGRSSSFSFSVDSDAFYAALAPPPSPLAAAAAGDRELAAAQAIARAAAEAAAEWNSYRATWSSSLSHRADNFEYAINTVGLPLPPHVKW